MKLEFGLGDNVKVTASASNFPKQVGFSFSLARISCRPR